MSASWFASRAPLSESLALAHALQNPASSAALNEWMDGRCAKLDARVEKMDSKFDGKAEIVALLKETRQTLEERVRVLEAKNEEQNVQLLELSGLENVNKFLVGHNAELKSRIQQLEQR
jgi:hypothetical protein